MNTLCPLPGCDIDRIVQLDPNRLIVAAHSRRDYGRCPDCGTRSTAVHSRYERRPADLPSFGREVRLSLRVRRFYCRQALCPRRTFVEQMPALVRPRQRRTRRLAKAQERIGIALGGEAGARLLSHLAMPTSADTLLRLIRGLPLPSRVEPRVLGVDDWAMKKGRTYGTILVDLERRRALDLLPDRSAATFSAWLRRHPQVEVIARDRSTEYACGADADAPSATQVADRWHLLLNARQMVERWLASTHARLRRLPSVSLKGLPSDRRTRAYPRTRAEAAASVDRRERWRAIYAEVRRRHAGGESLRAIGRAMELARRTVRKYAQAESFPGRAPRGPGPSLLDPFLPHLNARLAAGCENAAALWRELRALGYPGSAKQAYGWLAERRTAPAKTTVHRWRSTLPVRAGSTMPALPSPRQLAWLLVRERTALDASEAAILTRVEQDREATTVAGLAHRFCALVRGCRIRHQRRGSDNVAELDRWLAEARACGIGTVETFAAGLEQDGAAVRAALTLPWSSGQAEGQITRLKLLKRSMYGRASFDLLRRRMLLAA
jgi:transposase